MCPPRAPAQVDKVFPAHSNTDDLAVVAAYLEAMHTDSVRLILGFSQGGWGVCLGEGKAVGSVAREAASPWGSTFMPRALTFDRSCVPHPGSLLGCECLSG